MSKNFIVDASVAVAWVHPAQATKETDAMLQAIEAGATVEVPVLWTLEVANALVVLVRRNKLAEAERQSALGWLRVLPVKLDHDMTSLGFTVLSEFASEHALSVYDAAYLELAKRRKLPLGCKDGALREAARRSGVKLWS